MESILSGLIENGYPFEFYFCGLRIRMSINGLLFCKDNELRYLNSNWKSPENFQWWGVELGSYILLPIIG